MKKVINGVKVTGWTVFYRGVMEVMAIKCESRAIAQALAGLFTKHGLRAIAIAHVKGE